MKIIKYTSGNNSGAAVSENKKRILQIKPQLDTYYKKINGVRLPVKMYIPQGKTKDGAAVLAIHGGSWNAVMTDENNWDGGRMNFQAQYYADKEYVSAAISYRSINFDDTTTVFDLIEDCKDAVRYMRNNADFDKLIIIGDSAGGHLAVELGMDVNVGASMVVGANPVLDLTADSWSATAKTAEERKKASPVYNIKKCNASFLIMHGNRDKVADCKISRTFCEGMNRLGNKCNYYELDGAEHAFILSDYTSTDEQVDFYMKIIDDYIEKSI